jgi:hypothetical protein
MTRIHTLFAATGLAVAALAVPAAASAAVPAATTAAVVHPASIVGFTGFGAGRFGSFALSFARSDARAQIAAAGLDLNRDHCFEVSNFVPDEPGDDRLFHAESIWSCDV